MIRKSLVNFRLWVPVLLSGIIALSTASACNNFTISIDSVLNLRENDTPHGTIAKLNKNVKGLNGLAKICMYADSVALFSIDYNNDGCVLYWISTKSGENIELYSEIVSDEIGIPVISMVHDRDSIYWTINGSFLLDSSGNRVCVTDLTRSLSFFLNNNIVFCRLNDTVIGTYPITRADYLARDVAIDYDIDNHRFIFNLSSGFQSSLPTVSGFSFQETSVQNRSFYKDVFLDAGIALTSRKTLAAAEYLNLSIEGISFPYSNASANDKALQTAIISGDSWDQNGRLLYPDGQPRYKLLFVNGGDSTIHGQSLGDKGLANMRSFVENGGSYVGTCAGAFLASNGYDGKVDYPYYLSLWPGMMQHSGLSNTNSGMFIERDSPLLRYYDYGGDYYVDSVRHNAGGFPNDPPEGTEVLARYDYPKRASVHMKPSIWAYKESPRHGRIIMEGSHPEEVPDGERRDLTAAMMLYAMEGVGTVSIKGYLKQGHNRIMDKNTSDKDPSHSRIGDLQTHHFATYIPSNAKNIRVRVSSKSKCDLALMMNQGTFAFSDVAEYHSTASGAEQELFFPTIREGFWYIAVQCLTTVTVTETNYGQEYGGNLSVLNGIPYQILINWD